MPRTRTLTVAGVLAGAAILGGAGLAGAADGEPEVLDEVVEAPVAELDTGEPEDAPVAPTLPDEAAEQATEALAEAPAFSDDPEVTDEEDAADEDSDLDEETDAEDAETEDPAAQPDNHGQYVSGVARADDPGPGPDHGPAVSEAARENGRSGDAAGQQD